MNEIEQDDDEDAIIYSKSDYFDDEQEGVNWLQEAAEHQIQEEDQDGLENLSTNETQVNFEGHLKSSNSEKTNTNNLEKKSKATTNESS